MVDPSDAELELLLELQETDHRLTKLRHQLDQLPEQAALDAATAEHERVGAQLDAVAAELVKAEADAETLDADIRTLTSRRDTERARLYDGSVTNQREMSSVEAEIDSTVARIDEHEEDLLTVLEQVEELEGRRDRLTAQRDDAAATVASSTAARDAAAKQLLVDIGETEAVRERQAAGLPDELRQRYETAAARAGGTGVGKLDQGACSACRIDFSMVDLDELYKGPPLATCPQCRRLLVVGRG